MIAIELTKDGQLILHFKYLNRERTFHTSKKQPAFNIVLECEIPATRENPTIIYLPDYYAYSMSLFIEDKVNQSIRDSLYLSHNVKSTQRTNARFILKLLEHEVFSDYKKEFDRNPPESLDQIFVFFKYISQNLKPDWLFEFDVAILNTKIVEVEQDIKQMSANISQLKEEFQKHAYNYEHIPKLNPYVIIPEITERLEKIEILKQKIYKKLEKAKAKGYMEKLTEYLPRLHQCICKVDFDKLDTLVGRYQDLANEYAELRIRYDKEFKDWNEEINPNKGKRYRSDTMMGMGSSERFFKTCKLTVLLPIPDLPPTTKSAKALEACKILLERNLMLIKESIRDIEALEDFEKQIEGFKYKK